MKDINYILKVIPHRYPFLLVDRILDKEIVAIAEFLASVVKK